VFRAVVLDFDGLILDTESPVYESWRVAYEEHGHEIPRDRWFATIGSDHSTYHPLEDLRSLIEDLDEEALQLRRRKLRDEILHALEPMPGIVELLERARSRGLGVAVASSSPLDWVDGHLRRLGLRDCFDALATADDVSAVKPSPEIYLRALALLGVEPVEAIAFEDSPNGVAAARAAGIYCVAVPGPMTRSLSFDAANLVVESLADHPLETLLADASRAR
jgi:HAD superfamily hydrolase (TIGR01509 family)